MYAKYAKIRDERGLSDLAVANGAGIPQSTIYDWKQRSTENSKAALSVAHLKRIADFLHISIDDLLEA